MNEHRLAERRSLALHAEVARRIGTDPAVLSAARGRVAEWLAGSGPVAVPHVYASAWQALLDGPPAALLEMLAADDERARSLRQVSPFAGAVDAATRWRIWRSVSST